MVYLILGIIKCKPMVSEKRLKYSKIFAFADYIPQWWHQIEIPSMRRKYAESLIEIDGKWALDSELIKQRKNKMHAR